MAPPPWDVMNRKAFIGETLRVTRSASVTTGFKWAPEYANEHVSLTGLYNRVPYNSNESNEPEKITLNRGNYQLYQKCVRKSVWGQQRRTRQPGRCRWKVECGPTTGWTIRRRWRWGRKTQDTRPRWIARNLMIEFPLVRVPASSLAGPFATFRNAQATSIAEFQHLRSLEATLRSWSSFFKKIINSICDVD